MVALHQSAITEMLLPASIMGILINALICAFFLAGLCLMASLAQAVRGQPRRRPVRRKNPLTPLQIRLAGLLNGDIRTGYRLVVAARKQYPRKSEAWYWEKVIFDLERDRRS
jgi:hypothetical protein